MKLQYLRSWTLTELYRVARSEAHRYATDTPWLEEIFRDRPFLADSRLDIGKLPELQVPDSETKLYEYENTVLIHSALRGLNRSQAADDRLWSWLAHGPYWAYMRKRWPIENAKSDTKTSYIHEHYFLGDSRGLVRHGLARLWWFGHATYMSEASDPYALTRFLLKTTDARQQIMERQFWRNQRILHPFLRRVAHWVEKKGLDLYAPRERFRNLCKMMNLTGGASVLDTLASQEIHGLIDRYAETQGNNN